MGNIVAFSIGCRKCESLLRIDKNTYICSRRVRMDNSSIIPIKDGKESSDWNFCKGEFYSRKQFSQKGEKG